MKDIMIGLLGESKMSKDKMGMLESSCPLAFEEDVINEGNKRKAVLLAKYGEGKDPNKTCGTCEFFMTDDFMKACGLKKGEGFCKIWEFKCAATNTCQSWEAGEEPEEEYEDEEDYEGED